jgi:hypothetical protein
MAPGAFARGAGNIIERIPPAAPLAGLIAPRSRAPPGGFQKLTRCIGPAATLNTRARRIG